MNAYFSNHPSCGGARDVSSPMGRAPKYVYSGPEWLANVGEVLENGLGDAGAFCELERHAYTLHH